MGGTSALCLSHGQNLLPAPCSTHGGRSFFSLLKSAECYRPIRVSLTDHILNDHPWTLIKLMLTARTHTVTVVVIDAVLCSFSIISCICVSPAKIRGTQMQSHVPFAPRNRNKAQGGGGIVRLSVHAIARASVPRVSLLCFPKLQ